MKTGFGWIEVKGTRYAHDIILHTDGSVTKRKKKDSKALKGRYGHTPLSEYELGFLNEEHPDVVFVGTGQNGLLPVTPEAEKILSAYTTIMKPTAEILSDVQNEERPRVAILHVTC
jgi:hypothetical protein